MVEVKDVCYSHIVRICVSICTCNNIRARPNCYKSDNYQRRLSGIRVIVIVPAITYEHDQCPVVCRVVTAT